MPTPVTRLTAAPQSARAPVTDRETLALADLLTLCEEGVLPSTPEGDWRFGPDPKTGQEVRLTAHAQWLARDATAQRLN